MPEHDATGPTASHGKATWQTPADSAAGTRSGEAALPTWQQTPRATPPPMGSPAPLTTPPRKAPAPASPAPGTAVARTAAPQAPAVRAATALTGPPAQAPARTAAQASAQAPAPRATRTRVRIAAALRRRRLPLAAVLPCLVLAGVGWWRWPSQPAPVPLHLVAGTVHAALLTPEQASRLTGVSLTSGPRAAEPAPALAADPSSCGIAVGPATQAVYGKDWTAFLSATYQDAGGFGDYTLTQVAGVYPDSAKAGAVLQGLAAGLRSCPSAVRTDQDGRSSRWTYRVDAATQDGVAWTAVQDGGNGWACYRQAQLKGRSLLQAGICEAGDGRPTVQALTLRIAAGVGE